MTLFGLLILTAIVVSLLTIAVACVSFAPWVPMRNKDLKRIFKLADLKQGEIFYDLGCGTGKVIMYANKNFKAKTIGVELALPLFLICKIRWIFNGDKNLFFKFGNLFKEDLRKADAVYIYGMPHTIKNKLREKLEKELKPGARVISYVFSIDGWQPATVDKPSNKDVSIYLYKR